MTDPETRARQRWKQAAKALDDRDRVARLLDEANARAAWLRERLPAAVHEARREQAEAFVKEKPVPASGEPARLQAELAALEERLQALELAYDIVARNLHGLRRGQQNKWREEQARAVAKARWLVEEEGGRKNRQTLAEEESLFAWADEPLADTYVGLVEAGQLAAVAYPAPRCAAPACSRPHHPGTRTPRPHQRAGNRRILMVSCRRAHRQSGLDGALLQGKPDR